MASSAHSTSSSLSSRKLIGLGIVAGAAIGALASARTRQQQTGDSTAGGEQGFIDWGQVRAIATNLNRGEALTAVERSELDQAYRNLVATCLPVVSGYMGVSIVSPLERTFSFDRVDWINANIDGFKQLMAPIEAIGASATGGNSIAAHLLGGFNRTVVSAEMGLLLGYLAKKVLGQYDLALLGGEADTGKLYYVEPNIRMVERTLRLPRHEFRLWLALHETTHVFQFEGFLWVRPYFHGLLNEYFEFLKMDADVLRNGVQGLRTLVGRVRANAGTGDGRSWIEALMTPEQRGVFDRMQALMCMIEGYSNHVMNAIGSDLLSNYALIAKRFEQRQKEKSYAEQLFARITGLNLKMEQYRLGEQFVNAIASEHGKGATLRIWESPETLPTMAEIRNPPDWAARVLAATPIPQGSQAGAAR